MTQSVTYIKVSCEGGGGLNYKLKEYLDAGIPLQ